MEKYTVYLYNLDTGDGDAFRVEAPSGDAAESAARMHHDDCEIAIISVIKGFHEEVV